MTLTIGLAVAHDFYVACDEPHCGAAYQRDGGSVDEIIGRITAIGWTIRGGHYCPAHREGKR